MLGSAMATVGESLAANAAGPDGRPAVHHVQGLTLVLPSGQLVRASRRRNAELFALAAGGNGAIGALYSITLDIASICAALDEAVGAEVLAAPRAACARRALRVFVPPLEVQKFLEDAQALCHGWRMERAGVRHNGGKRLVELMSDGCRELSGRDDAVQMSDLRPLRLHLDLGTPSPRALHE